MSNSETLITERAQALLPSLTGEAREIVEALIAEVARLQGATSYQVVSGSDVGAICETFEEAQAVAASWIEDAKRHVREIGFWDTNEAIEIRAVRTLRTVARSVAKDTGDNFTDYTIEPA